MLGLTHSTYIKSRGLHGAFINKYFLSFNGTDESVQIDALGDDMETNAGTISAWVILNDTSGSATVIRCIADSNNQIFIFRHASSDEIRFVYKAAGTTSIAAFDASSFNHTEWTHLAMTWSAASDELKGFINGDQVGGTQSSLGTFSGDIASVDLGQNGSDGAFLKGSLDEVSVWKSVIDIDTLYNNGVRRNVKHAGLDNTKLVGYYQFEEGSGTSTKDSSRNANHGTLVNTPTWSSF